MTARTLIAAIVIVLAHAAAPGLCHAQTLNAEAVIADLGSGETGRVQRARDAAVDYLGAPGLRVSDRLSTVEALGEAVATAVASDDEFVVANGLLIAGYFVTPSGFQLLTDRLSDERPGVRYAAYRGLRSSFSILSDQSSPSLQPNAAQNAFRKLLDAAKSEADANTLGSSYRAIAEAMSMTSNSLKPLETTASASLGTVAAARIGQLSGLSDQDYTFTLGATIYAALEYRKILGEPGRRLDDDTATAAATLAGELIGHAYGEFEKSGSISAIESGKREALRQALSSAESVAFLALRKLGQDATETDLAGLFANADDRAFRAAVFRLIGPAGSIPGAGITLDNAPTGG